VLPSPEAVLGFAPLADCRADLSALRGAGVSVAG